MNKIRIIGGQYKNRRLPVLNREGLRPSPERVRETLYNWLQFEIQGMRVLDAFAGSGALGLEALSRGAAWVDFYDTDRSVCQQLQKHLHDWHANNARVFTQSALALKTRETYDLVLLDPPFAAHLYAELLPLAQHWLKPHGYLYLEHPRGLALDLPEGFVWHKQAHAGNIAFGLLSNLTARQHAQSALSTQVRENA